jgi:hypothetical protein
MLGFGFAPTFERRYFRPSSSSQFDELINKKEEEKEEEERKCTLKKVKRVYSGLNQLDPTESSLEIIRAKKKRSKKTKRLLAARSFSVIGKT